MRIMDPTRELLASVPREARLAASAPHLITTIFLENPFMTLWTILGILLEHLHCLLILLTAFMGTVPMYTLVPMTIGTCPVFTEAALIHGGNTPTTVLAGTRHEKDRLVIGRGGFCDATIGKLP